MKFMVAILLLAAACAGSGPYHPTRCVLVTGSNICRNTVWVQRGKAALPLPQGAQAPGGVR